MTGKLNQDLMRTLQPHVQTTYDEADYGGDGGSQAPVRSAEEVSADWLRLAEATRPREEVAVSELLGAQLISPAHLKKAMDQLRASIDLEMPVANDAAIAAMRLSEEVGVAAAKAKTIVDADPVQPAAARSPQHGRPQIQTVTATPAEGPGAYEFAFRYETPIGWQGSLTRNRILQLSDDEGRILPNAADKIANAIRNESSLILFEVAMDAALRETVRASFSSASLDEGGLTVNYDVNPFGPQTQRIELPSIGAQMRRTDGLQTVIHLVTGVILGDVRMLGMGD